MDDRLREGDILSLPCRWCASVSIKLRIQPGTAVKSCPRCGELTRFDIRSGPDGLEINSKTTVRRFQPDDVS